MPTATLLHRSGWKLALDIAKGLYHLHSKKIVHMDLKSPNILLNAARDQAKISDVGLAKFTSEAGTIATQGELSSHLQNALHMHNTSPV